MEIAATGDQQTKLLRQPLNQSGLLRRVRAVIRLNAVEALLLQLANDALHLALAVGLQVGRVREDRQPAGFANLPDGLLRTGHKARKIRRFPFGQKSVERFLLAADVALL